MYVCDLCTHQPYTMEFLNGENIRMKHKLYREHILCTRTGNLDWECACFACSIKLLSRLVNKIMEWPQGYISVIAVIRAPLAIKNSRYFLKHLNLILLVHYTLLQCNPALSLTMVKRVPFISIQLQSICWINRIINKCSWSSCYEAVYVATRKACTSENIPNRED